MVWIIDTTIHKVRQVSLGSAAMMAATNVFMSEQEAKQAFDAICAHPTRLGNSRTGAVTCADCNRRLA
jgi:hypothetical protein